MNSTNPHSSAIAKAIAILAAILTLPALVVPFVPFVFGTSPLDTAIEKVSSGSSWWAGRIFLLLGAPFFLGLPLVVTQIARLVSLSASRMWRIIGFALAAISAALSLTFVGTGAVEMLQHDGPFRWQERIVVLLAPAILVSGGAWLWRARHATGAMTQIFVALTTAYLANASLCLFGFIDDGDLGWRLALVACAGIALDVTRIVVTTHRRAGD